MVQCPRTPQTGFVALTYLRSATNRLTRKIEKLKKARIAIYYQNMYYHLSLSTELSVEPLFRALTAALCDCHKAL